MKKNILLFLLSACAIQFSSAFCMQTPTLLVDAAMDGDFDECSKLIDGGEDVNQKDVDGMTALHYAAFFGKLDIAQLLINNNADKTIKNNDDQTALDLAQKNRNPRKCYEYDEIIVLLGGPLI